MYVSDSVCVKHELPPRVQALYTPLHMGLASVAIVDKLLRAGALPNSVAQVRVSVRVC